MIIFDGNALAGKIAPKLAQNVLDLPGKPKLAIVAVQPDARSLAYIKAKQARASQIGIENALFMLDSTSQPELESLIKKIATDDTVHGIIVQLPLPKNLDTQKILSIIPVSKDVDGLTHNNTELLKAGRAVFIPATVQAILTILEINHIALENKKIVVVGQGALVGKPLALLLKQKGYSAEVADINTHDLSLLTHSADVVVSATGKPKLITADLIKTGAVVIDAGVSESNGSMVGDVDFESVAQKASFITPVPGGVGPVTVIELMQNVIKAASKNKSGADERTRTSTL